jgi:ketosteroid isomerase-like protein
MPSPSDTIIELEKKFWQSIVDGDAETACEMLTEPALMVSSHGAMQFDHAGYRRMAENGPMVLKSYELTDVKVVFPNETTAVCTYHAKQELAKRGDEQGSVQEVNDTSTWIKEGPSWRCVMHTETPASENRKMN